MARTQKPKSLSPRQRRVVVLYHQGLKRPQIAEEVGYGSTRISEIINSEPGRKYMAELLSIEEEVVVGEVGQRVRARLEAEAMSSIKTMEALLHGAESESIQLKAAISILDRTVPRKVTTPPATPQLVVSDKMMDKLLKALDEDKRIVAAIEAERVQDSDEPKNDSHREP